MGIVALVGRWGDYVLSGLFKAWEVMWSAKGSTLFFAGALVGVLFLFILIIIQGREPRRARRRGLVQFSSPISGPRLLGSSLGGSSQARLSSRESLQIGGARKALLPPKALESLGVAPKSAVAPKSVLAPKLRSLKWRLAPKFRRKSVAPKKEAVAPKSKPEVVAPKPEAGLPPKKRPSRARRIFDTLVPPPDKRKKRKRRGKEVVVLEEGVPGRRYISLNEVR